jgi:hypothetical protein
MVRASFRAAMIPTVNGMLTVGLVQLPGMMTGQILAGSSTLVAIRYQMVVVFIQGGHRARVADFRPTGRWPLFHACASAPALSAVTNNPQSSFLVRARTEQYRPSKQSLCYTMRGQTERTQNNQWLGLFDDTEVEYGNKS